MKNKGQKQDFMKIDSFISHHATLNFTAVALFIIIAILNLETKQ